MLRCSESAGNFTVTMIHSAPEERRQQLQLHADVYEQIEVPNKVPVEYIQGKLLESSPVLSSVTPFIGELCEHELLALRNPVKFISPELIFHIEQIG